MKTIVFLGSNKFGTSTEALTVAKEMGFYIVLLTDKKTHYFPNVDQFIYIKNLMDEKTCIDAIKKLREQGKNICACLSFIDPYISYTARLAKHFNLTEISFDALYLMENKIRFREILKSLPCSPYFTIFNNNEDIEQFAENHKSLLPFIIKPPTSNGSKDVLFVEKEEYLKNALQFLRQKRPEQLLLAEEFLLGPQYLIEVLVYKNELNIIGVIAQEFSDDGSFIITGYQFPAMLEEKEYRSLVMTIQEIIAALGLSNGSCHLEMRHVNGVWKLVEINPRMSGGAMNRIIEEGTGINLIKEIIKLHLGEAPSLIKTKNQHVYAKYLTISSRGKLLKVIGKDEALKHNGVKYVYVKPLEGKILTNPSTMGHRYACIIAASESPEEAKSIAIAAAMEIKFYLEPF